MLRTLISNLSFGIVLLQLSLVTTGRAGAETHFPPEYPGDSLLIPESEARSAAKTFDSGIVLESLAGAFDSAPFGRIGTKTVIETALRSPEYVAAVNRCMRSMPRPECESRVLKAAFILARNAGVFDDYVYLALLDSIRPAFLESLAEDPLSGPTVPDGIDQSLARYAEKLDLIRMLSPGDEMKTSASLEKGTHYVLYSSDKITMRVRLYRRFTANEILRLGEIAKKLILRVNSESASLRFSHSTLGEDEVSLSHAQRRQWAKVLLDSSLEEAMARGDFKERPEDIDVFAAAIETRLLSLSGIEDLLRLPEFESPYNRQARNRRFWGGVYRIVARTSVFIPVYGGWASFIMSLGESIHAQRRR